jgi:hypothetical protein
MNAIYRLDRTRGVLFDAEGRCFDAATGCWHATANAPGGEEVDALAAAEWRQRHSGSPVRVPVGVIGPREAPQPALVLARAVGSGLAGLGFAVLCGGRGGIMQAVCEGTAAAGGVSIGLLPEADPALANPYATLVLATGIGEARNALIARAALCLVAIGDSFGTLSEVALGRQFGKRVIGLAGAARVEGVRHVADVPAALEEVARCALALP